jgi:hypothetical protein
MFQNIDYKKNIDWFLSKSKDHRSEILLIAICALLGYAVYIGNNREQTKNIELNQLRYEKRISDSLCDVRYHNSLSVHQEDLQQCQEQQKQFLESQAKIWQTKYEQLFKKSDSVYHKIKN